MSDVKINDKELAENGVICREIKTFPGGRRIHFIELGVWSDTTPTGEKIA